MIRFESLMEIKGGRGVFKKIGLHTQIPFLSLPPFSLFTPPAFPQAGARSLPATVPRHGGGIAPRLHTQNLQFHNILLGVKGLGAAELKAGPEGATRATEVGLIQGQDGVVITALLQRVVDLVPTPGAPAGTAAPLGQWGHLDRD